MHSLRNSIYLFSYYLYNMYPLSSHSSSLLHYTNHSLLNHFQSTLLPTMFFSFSTKDYKAFNISSTLLPTSSISIILSSSPIHYLIYIRHTSFCFRALIYQSQTQ